MEILSYGATGSQGFPVARKLLDAGHEVRVLTRNSGHVRGLEGAQVFEGDMADRDSLAEASASVDGVFLHIPFFTERPDDGLIYAKNAVAAAVSAGANLLVWNASGEIPPARGMNPAFDMRLDILDVVTGSGIPYVPRLLRDKETREVMRCDFTASMGTDRTERVTLTKDEILGTG